MKPSAYNYVHQSNNHPYTEWVLTLLSSWQRVYHSTTVVIRNKTPRSPTLTLAQAHQLCIAFILRRYYSFSWPITRIASLTKHSMTSQRTWLTKQVVTSQRTSLTTHLWRQSGTFIQWRRTRILTWRHNALPGRPSSRFIILWHQNDKMGTPMWLHSRLSRWRQSGVLMAS